jgi:hypothetical protein
MDAFSDEITRTRKLDAKIAALEKSIKDKEAGLNTKEAKDADDKRAKAEKVANAAGDDYKTAQKLAEEAQTKAAEAKTAVPADILARAEAAKSRIADAEGKVGRSSAAVPTVFTGASPIALADDRIDDDEIRRRALDPSIYTRGWKPKPMSPEEEEAASRALKTLDPATMFSGLDKFGSPITSTPTPTPIPATGTVDPTSGGMLDWGMLDMSPAKRDALIKDEARKFRKLAPDPSALLSGLDKFRSTITATPTPTPVPQPVPQSNTSNPASTTPNSDNKISLLILEQLKAIAKNTASSFEIESFNV